MEVKLNVTIRPPDDQPEVLPVDCELDIEFQHTGMSVHVKFMKYFQFWSVTAKYGKYVREKGPRPPGL